jgi:hypothetical protein
MPANPPLPLTTDQAIERARRMIDAGQKLTRAAAAVSEARNSPVQAAAEALKEHALLGYRVSTVPDALGPVLEALILAASGAAATKELEHVAS